MDWNILRYSNNITPRIHPENKIIASNNGLISATKTLIKNIIKYPFSLWSNLETKKERAALIFLSSGFPMVMAKAALTASALETH